MNKLFFTVILLLFAICSCESVQAQSYSSDAHLVSLNNNIATIRGTGVADKKKDAAEMAGKSAIYTYLTSGIKGLNNGRALIKDINSPAAAAYLSNLFGTSRYSIFINNIVVDKDAARKTPNGHMATITFTLYPDAISKDLIVNNVNSKSISDMSLDETQDAISLPTIMVVPYCSGDQSYLEAIQQNPDIRMAMARVTEGFISEGVETKNFEQLLRNAEEAQARQGDLSLNDALLNVSGADVTVQLDITKDTDFGGLRISMVLTAIETATGNTLASKSETSARKNANANVICTALAQHMVGDFLKQISTRLADKVASGNTIVVNFSIDPNSVTDMDTELDDGSYLPLSDAIIIWIKKNAKNGKYHQKGRTSTSLILDEIQIDNSSDNGADINSFSLDLYLYMRGLGITVKRNLVGNTIHITLM